MSSFDVNSVCTRGATVPSGRNTDVYGKLGIFANIAALTDRAPRDQRNVWMRFVKNDSGGALLPGQTLAWKTGYAGLRVTNPAATAGVLICGIVDHLLAAAGVADGEAFLMTVLGPTKMLLDNNATSAEFDNLLNSGGVAGTVRSGTHGAAGSCGRNEASGTTAAGTAGTLAAATSFWGYFGATMGGL